MLDFIITYIEPLFILFIFYAVLGWIIEVVGKLFQEHKFINRGFLIGPYCPIYGWGAVFITILLREYSDNRLILFVMSMFICTVIEYLTSYFMEKTYKVRWWDYSQKKFNINGRVCLQYAVLFGLGGVLIVRYINPFVLSLVHKVPSDVVNILCIVVLAIFVLDNIVSSAIIHSFKTLAKSKTKDATEDVSKKVQAVLDNYSEKVVYDIKSKADIIADKIALYRKAKSDELKKELAKKSYLHRRLLDAFPNSVIKNKNDDKIKEELNKENK